MILDKPAMRLVVLGWCLWLLLAGLAGGLGVGAGVHLSLPTTRWMVLAVALGLMLCWPAMRLALSRGEPGAALSDQDAGGFSGRAMGRTLYEWLVLVIIFQAVLWPLKTMALWSMTQAMWLNLAIGAWSLLAAACLAWGRGFRRSGPRVLAMLLCVAMLGAEPLWVALTGWGGAGLGRLSPLATLWALTVVSHEFRPDPWRERVVGALLAAMMAWAGLLAGALIRRYRHPAGSSVVGELDGPAASSGV